jgi:hypothetical protein
VPFTALAQNPPNANVNVDLTFDQPSTFMDRNQNLNFTLIQNATGVAHAQITNGTIKITGLKVQFDVGFCGTDSNCTHPISHHVWVHFDQVVGQVALVGGEMRFNLGNLTGKVHVQGGSTVSFLAGSGAINYTGPPPIGAPITSYDVDFSFYSAELGTTIDVFLSSQTIKVE